MDLFLKGLIIGLAISIPMGPVALFAIHRVIAHSRISGLVVGLGSIAANLIFGIIAVYGLTAVTSVIAEYHTGLRVFGGSLLLLISISIIFSKTKKRVIYDDDYYAISKDFATGFLLAITNPLTILALIALFAWFGLDSTSSSLITAFELLLGFIVGLLLWWISLTKVTDHFKKKIQIPSFGIINQIFGAVLFILSILILFEVI